MITLHVETQVRDYESWKEVFDKFDRFRAEQNVRSYRVARDFEDPNSVTIDMEFDSVEDATAFRGALEKIWATPQSQEQLVSHRTPQIQSLVEHRAIEVKTP